MVNYLELLYEILHYGDNQERRNGPARTLFGRTLEYRNIYDDFPILTTKEVNFKAIVAELLGFIRGADNASIFEALGTKIWNANSEAECWTASSYYKGPGDLGRIYSAQWRNWRSALVTVDSYGMPNIEVVRVDQLKELVEMLLADNDQRRAIVSAWNPGEIKAMALPPCHVLYQVHIGGKKNQFLDMNMYQRSVDICLGLPFNITSYAILLYILAQISNKQPRNLLLTLGDVHIYENQLDLVEAQLDRPCLEQPRLIINPFLKTLKDFEQATVDDFKLADYYYHPKINYPFSV